ncbi:MAG: hypothetical protein RSC06_13525 [Clostridia bacterium]
MESIRGNDVQAMNDASNRKLVKVSTRAVAIARAVAITRAVVANWEGFIEFLEESERVIINEARVSNRVLTDLGTEK